jgi:outer membrane receptor protein involved in Fe transport
MVHFRVHSLALGVALAYPLSAMAADPVPAAAAAAASSATDGAGQAPTANPDKPAPDKVVITATRQRLDDARNGLSPDTGSTVYRFDRQDLANLPLGDSTPLNQVVLQAPGVVQDSYGQLHVRGDHANVQYRIDGVVIPEAISGFGQSLETRFADRLNILTGALPAQYGYRTAGVVDIHTKGGTVENGGHVGLTFGSRGHAQAQAEVGGTQGALSYYLTGSSLRDDVGIENPTAERNALHDDTRQAKGFGYLSYLLGSDSRVNLLFGTADNRFQIPNVPGQPPQFTLDGAPAVDSAALDARQRERNRFAVLSYQASAGERLDYQVSLFHRYTDVHYEPDPVGDLVFNGIAADVLRKNEAAGVQGDLSWRVGATHTLRAGVFAQHERYAVSNASLVFPADADGNQTSGTPLQIEDDTRLAGRLWGLYVQDEWQPSKRLTVNYGLRYDKVDTVANEQQLSPRLGLIYDLSQDLRVHAGYARYFTPPPTEKIDTTSVQKFLGTTNALPSDANTAVKSERSHYFDAGLSYQATPQITLGVDTYYRRVRHLQDEGQFGNALIYSAFNYDEGKIRGIELSGSYREKNLSAYANVALSRALGKGIETGQFNFDPDELDYIANHWVHLDHDQQLTASAGLSYRWASSLSVSADALFGSGLRRGFANSEHLPSYTQINAAIAREFDLGGGLGKFDARLALLNVFDRVYQLRDGSGIGVGAPQFGLRRTVYVSIGKSF